MAEKKKLDVTDQDTSSPDSTDPNAVSTTPNTPADNPPVAQDDSLFQVGDAGNRPSNPAVNTIYYSINTGSRDRYLGDGNWENIDNLHG